MKLKKAQVKQYTFGKGLEERESLDMPFLLWRDDVVYYINQTTKELVGINNTRSFKYKDEEVCYYDEAASKLTFASGEVFLVLEQYEVEETGTFCYSHELLNGFVEQYSGDESNEIYNEEFVDTVTVFVVNGDNNGLIVNETECFRTYLTEREEEEFSLEERICHLENTVSRLEDIISNQNTGCCGR